jgi:hypothetical protein
MKRSIILFFLLVVFAILAYGRVGIRQVPGATTQSEQRRIKGMSVIVTDM